MRIDTTKNAKLNHQEPLLNTKVVILDLDLENNLQILDQFFFLPICSCALQYVHNLRPIWTIKSLFIIYITHIKIRPFCMRNTKTSGSKTRAKPTPGRTCKKRPQGASSQDQDPRKTSLLCAFKEFQDQIQVHSRTMFLFKDFSGLEQPNKLQDFWEPVRILNNAVTILSCYTCRRLVPTKQPFWKAQAFLHYSICCLLYTSDAADE